MAKIIDEVGREQTICLKTDWHVYNFIDQSDTFKHVIATTVENLCINYNSKVDIGLCFVQDLLTHHFQIIFPKGEIIEYNGWFHIHLHTQSFVWDLRGFIHPTHNEYTQLNRTSNLIHDSIDPFLAVLANSLMSHRYFMKRVSEPQLQICENVGTVLQMCKYIDKKYVYSLLVGAFNDLILENNLQEIIEVAIGEDAFSLQTKSQVKIVFHHKTYCFGLIVSEHSSPYFIIYDKEKDRLAPIVDEGVQFVTVNNDTPETIACASLKPVTKDTYFDAYSDYTAVLHLLRLFHIFINRYRFLFRPVNKSFKDDYDEIMKQLVGFDAFPRPPLPTNIDQNIYVSTHPAILSRIHEFCSIYPGVYSYPNNERIIIKNRSVLHLSIFKNSLRSGQFHLTNECFRPDKHKHVFFTINIIGNMLVEDKKAFYTELAKKLLGDESVWTEEGRRRMRGKTMNDIKESIRFFYTLLCKCILDNTPEYFTNSEAPIPNSDPRFSQPYV